MRIRRTDANHKKLIDQLRQLPGVSVFSTHTIGKGFPDIVVGYGGKNYLFEIKDEDKTPSLTKLTNSEDLFHKKWQGQVDVVKNLGDCILKLQK